MRVGTLMLLMRTYTCGWIITTTIAIIAAAQKKCRRRTYALRLGTMLRPENLQGRVVEYRCNRVFFELVI
jgi:hypothetical protein